MSENFEQVSGPGWYPKAIHKPIKPGLNDAKIVPKQVILHTAVSDADSLRDFFATQSGGIESHFYIRRNGIVEQYRGIYWEADANYRANVRAVSVETAGYGNQFWTVDQLNSIKELLLWANKSANIPLKVIPEWDMPGVGYHVLFDEWHPTPKSCPGPYRINQFRDIIVPWMKLNNWSKKDLMDALDKAIGECKKAPIERTKVKDTLPKLVEVRDSLNKKN